MCSVASKLPGAPEYDAVVSFLQRQPARRTLLSKRTPLSPRVSPRLSRVPMRTTSLLLGVLGVAHAAIELTPDNFDDVVFNSGKAAFVKFLAPW